MIMIISMVSFTYDCMSNLMTYRFRIECFKGLMLGRPSHNIFHKTIDKASLNSHFDKLFFCLFIWQALFGFKLFSIDIDLSIAVTVYEIFVIYLVCSHLFQTATSPLCIILLDKVVVYLALLW